MVRRDIDLCPYRLEVCLSRMFSLIRQLSNGSSGNENINETTHLNDDNKNMTDGEERAQQHQGSVRTMHGVLTEAQICSQLELLRMGALPKPSNDYIGYVFKLVMLFNKLWEAHLEWATTHITNHVSVELAVGELLFARDDETKTEDEGAIEAASSLEMALSTGRYRYFLCMRSIKLAEGMLQTTLKSGTEALIYGFSFC